MTTKKTAASSRYGNGNGNGSNGKRVNWIALFVATWGVGVVAIGAAYRLGGRMETPEQKQARIDRAIGPIVTELGELKRSVDRHWLLGGHAVMEARMSAIERSIDSVNDVEREETDILREIADTLREQADHH